MWAHVKVNGWTAKRQRTGTQTRPDAKALETDRSTYLNMFDSIQDQQSTTNTPYDLMLLTNMSTLHKCVSRCSMLIGCLGTHLWQAPQPNITPYTPHKPLNSSIIALKVRKICTLRNLMSGKTANPFNLATCSPGRCFYTVMSGYIFLRTPFSSWLSFQGWIQVG